MYTDCVEKYYTFYNMYLLRVPESHERGRAKRPVHAALLGERVVSVCMGGRRQMQSPRWMTIRGSVLTSVIHLPSPQGVRTPHLLGRLTYLTHYKTKRKVEVRLDHCRTSFGPVL